MWIQCAATVHDLIYIAFNAPKHAPSPNITKLRAYPEEFGKNLLQAYEQHCATTGLGRRDLRFKPQFNETFDEVVQFDLLPLGDIWEEAELLPVIAYLMECKHCRTVYAVHI